MNIQLNKIIIWSKKQPIEKKEIDLSLGKLNIIHGASQTGKSAIISIIDYCLCSSKYSIPVGIIREKASWFGVVLNVDDKEILIARENKSKAAKYYFQSGEKIKVPEYIVSNESNEQFFKDKINNLLGIPFLELNEFSAKGSRPSFRDLVTFNFQPQNIVANANCLLYKTDIAQYRDRIKEIFNYAIGVETGKILADKQLYTSVMKKIEQLKKEKENKKQLIENEILNQQDFVLQAMKYKIINPNDFIPNNLHSIVDCLEKIVQNDLSKISLSEEGENQCLQQQQKLKNELSELMETFRKFQISKNSLEEIISLSKEENYLLSKQRNKLGIAKFLRDFTRKFQEDFSSINIEKLCSSLENIEQKIRNQNFSKNSIYVKKLSDVQLSINQTREEINKKLDSYKQLEKSLENKDIIEDYLQQMATAKTILSFYKQDLSAYDIKIKEYEEQLPKKPDIKLLLNVALQCIKNDMQKYKPSFSEFRYITQFDTQNLTVKISNDLDKDDFYLWETGSGSNWVAYHLAALLGFHRYFIDNKCPVFNFIIFDQPTQVYFPTAKYDAKNKLYTFNEDSSDYKNVQEMYAYMDKAVQDCNGHLQILVLDHTDESIWKKFQTVNEVADWSNREKDALIPNSW